MSEHARNLDTYNDGWADVEEEQKAEWEAEWEAVAAERADFHARVAKAQGHPSFRNYKPRG